MSEVSNFVTQFFVYLDGEKAPEPFLIALRKVSVDSSLVAPDVATLTLLDTDGTWCNHKSMLPGTRVQIRFGEDSDSHQIFDGDLVELETEFAIGQPRLTLRAFDKLHRLSHGRKTRSFVEVTDAEIARSMAKDAGLKAEVTDTQFVHPMILQGNESDLVFLARRAMLQGFVLYVRGETLHFCKPPAAADAIEVEWKQALRVFRPRLSGLRQFKKVVVRGWNPVTCKDVVGEHEKPDFVTQIGESLTGGELVADRFGLETERHITDLSVQDDDQAKEIARSVANQHASEFVEADGVVGGIPSLMAGAWLKVKGTGVRFDGTYFLTEVNHHYDPAMGYEVRFVVSGLRPGGLTALIASDPMKQLLTGLRVAIVTDNLDPEGLGRVKVRYPWLTGEHSSDWVRSVAVGGGAARGIEFLPEVDDEVLIGFEFGDINRPFNLGGLWNGKSPPPETNDSDTLVDAGKVHRRIIRSREGHEIILDDSGEKPGIRIKDKSGTMLSIDSEEGDLSVEVKGKAVLKVKGDITISSDGNVTLESKGDLALSAKGSLDLSATKSLTLSGKDATVKGTSGSVAIQATTSVDVSGVSINLG